MGPFAILGPEVARSVMLTEACARAYLAPIVWLPYYDSMAAADGRGKPGQVGSEQQTAGVVLRRGSRRTSTVL